MVANHAALQRLPLALDGLLVLIWEIDSCASMSTGLKVQIQASSLSSGSLKLDWHGIIPIQIEILATTSLPYFLDSPLGISGRLVRTSRLDVINEEKQVPENITPTNTRYFLGYMIQLFQFPPHKAEYTAISLCLACH